MKTNRLNLFLGTSLGLLLVSCAAFNLGYHASEFEGKVLSARQGRGAERLQDEADLDATIKGVLATQGAPDYILVETVDDVKLIYVIEDRVISFHRGWGVISEASVEKLIPDQIANSFSVADRQLLEEVRDKRAGVYRQPPAVVAPVAAVENAAERGGGVTEGVTVPARSTRVKATPAASMKPVATRTPITPRDTATPRATATPRLPKATATPACMTTSDWRSGLHILKSSWSFDREFLPIATWTVRLKNVSCSTAFKDINFQTSYSAPSGTTVDESFFGHTEFISVRPGQTVTIKWTESAHSQSVRASVRIDSARVTY